MENFFHHNFATFSVKKKNNSSDEKIKNPENLRVIQAFR